MICSMQDIHHYHSYAKSFVLFLIPCCILTLKHCLFLYAQCFLCAFCNDSLFVLRQNHFQNAGQNMPVTKTSKVATISKNNEAALHYSLYCSLTFSTLFKWKQSLPGQSY